MSHSFVVAIAVLTLGAAIGQAEESAVERLHEHLEKASGHGHAAPPQASWPVNVNVSCNLIRVHAFCPLSHEAELHLWEEATWLDERLAWQPSDFGDLQTAQIRDVRDIWVPDLALYNEIGTPVGHDHFKGAEAIVMASGKVIVVASRAAKIVCNSTAMKRDGNQFQCQWTMGPWLSDTSRVDAFPASGFDPTVGGASTRYFEPNDNWELSGGEADFTVSKSLMEFDAAAGLIYPFIKYELHFQRAHGPSAIVRLERDTIANMASQPPLPQRPIAVSHGLALVSIRHFDVPVRRLKALVWEKVAWSDARAAFQSEDYAG